MTKTVKPETEKRIEKTTDEHKQTQIIIIFFDIFWNLNFGYWDLFGNWDLLFGNFTHTAPVIKMDLPSRSLKCKKL